MQRIIFFFLLCGMFFGAYAQHTDLKAIEKTYNDGDYEAAARSAFKLYKQAGEWQPPVLYIYLRSRYAVYSDTSSARAKPILKYEEMVRLSDLCNTFFELYKKGGAQKKNMTIVREYFLKMKMLSMYQQKRTPASAVAFLNDAAILFPNKSVGGYAHNGEVEFSEAHCSGTARVQLFFTLSKDTSFLFITGRNACDKGKKFTPQRKRFDICRFGDAIDLRHLPDSIVSDTKMPRVYCKLSRYNVTQKADSVALGAAQPFVVDGNTFADAEAGIQPCVVTYNDVKCVRAVTANETDVVFKTEYPVLWLFDETAPKFQKDEYVHRIRETFHYLITYFEKQQEAN